MALSFRISVLAGSLYHMPPANQEPAILAREDFARQRFAETWSIFPPEFEGRNVLAMIRRQAWTAKPAAE